MIPAYPEFKSVELSDKEEVEKITRRFPPYSDFNFVSMWSWDIKGEVRISLLNGNLVVRFNDYLTGEPFYSFIGDTMVNETAERLLGATKSIGVEARLKLVPEEATKELDRQKFNVVEDRDHFDYVLLLEVLKDYDTSKTKSKRRAVQSFLKKFSPRVELLDLSSIEVQKKIFKLITQKAHDDSKTIENEMLAITRLISNHNQIGLSPLGVYLGDELVGFYFSEELGNQYAMAHFWKANTKVSQSVYSYLMQEKAKFLHNKGSRFVNIEQDLGIDTLRQWKSSYGGEVFLKKYTVSLAQ